MIIFPAIDLYRGKAVRLVAGDYERMTVYRDDPAGTAREFKDCGAECVHVVDLEGAKSGSPRNAETVLRISRESGLFVQTGGGIRSMETIDRYIASGVGRVILGTAAAKDETLLKKAVLKYGGKIAVGADIKGGYVATEGWTNSSGIRYDIFFEKILLSGVETVICTDVSKDGVMSGTNRELYKELRERFSIKIIASGGISSLDDVRSLRDMGLYGAIVGTAYYTGALDLRAAIEAAR